MFTELKDEDEMRIKILNKNWVVSMYHKLGESKEILFHSHIHSHTKN